MDGEPSTNDCAFALANGASGVIIDDALYPALFEAFRIVARELALGIVRGGEGATKLVSITATGAATDADAWLAARAMANSLLVKTAMHGADPNWGRLVAAAGRSGRGVRARPGQGPDRFAGALRPTGRPFDERPLRPPSICRAPTSTSRSGWAPAARSPPPSGPAILTAEYVRINAEYRT